MLESKGFVETQRSTRQRFRAVETEEANKTLEKEYPSRTFRLEGPRNVVSPVNTAIDGERSQWSRY